MKVNRVTIEYRNPVALQGSAALGFTELQVSLQGRPPRRPHRGEDLFSIRAWLKGASFTCYDVRRLAQGRGRTPARYVERWSLNPPPPDPGSPGFTTRIHYDHRQACYVLVDGLEGIGHYTDRQAAEWAQLQHEFPTVYDLTQRFLDQLLPLYPDYAQGIELRTLRAARILALDHIEASHRQGSGTPQYHNHTYFISSQSRPGRTYETFVHPKDPKHWFCHIANDPDVGKIGHTCPDITNERAPMLKNGRRCKHMTAAFLKPRLAKKKEDSVATTESSLAANKSRITRCEHSTTLLPEVQAEVRHVTASYADGRPARYSDGAIVRYTAGGLAIEIPGSAA